MTRLRLLIVAWVGILCWATPSFAQDPHSASPSAEGHYQTAVTLFGEGRYREALDEFDAAIAVSPQAIFYCNRAIVLIKLQETEQAVSSLTECRDRFEGDAAERAQIDAQLGGVVAFHDHIRLRASEVANDIAQGPLATRSTKDTWGLQEWGLVTAGFGAAILGGAVVLDLSSKSMKDEYIEASRGDDPERYDELRSSLETRKVIFWSLAGVGSAAMVTGIVMVIWPATTTEQVQITPILGKDSAGVSGTFYW